MLNCKPITKLTNDVNDWRALTPLAILTGHLHPDSPVTEFNKFNLFYCNRYSLSTINAVPIKYNYHIYLSITRKIFYQNKNSKYGCALNTSAGREKVKQNFIPIFNQKSGVLVILEQIR